MNKNLENFASISAKIGFVKNNEFRSMTTSKKYIEFERYLKNRTEVENAKQIKNKDFLAPNDNTLEELSNKMGIKLQLALKACSITHRIAI
uniref:GIY-YIG homing endonuclease n=1 Tax=Romanomermis culicivorax TaxID=13658 RepID=A0A915K5L8_ROMCU